MPSPAGLWPWIALAGWACFTASIRPWAGCSRSRSDCIATASASCCCRSSRSRSAMRSRSRVVLAVLALGRWSTHTTLLRLAAVVLIGWALWHALYGHRQRVRVGMQDSLAGPRALVVPDGERAWRRPDAGPADVMPICASASPAAPAAERPLASPSPRSACTPPRCWRRSRHLADRLQLDRRRVSAPRLDQSRSGLDRRADRLRDRAAGRVIGPGASAFFDGRVSPWYCENMKNITVSVDDDTYRVARIKAAERETSVSALVKGFLTSLATEGSDFERLAREELALRERVRRFRAGGRLSRDDLHDRRR